MKFTGLQLVGSDLPRRLVAPPGTRLPLRGGPPGSYVLVEDLPQGCTVLRGPCVRNSRWLLPIALALFGCAAFLIGSGLVLWIGLAGGLAE